MFSEAHFSENLDKLCSRMAAACEAAGRLLDSVRLLPVTKNHPSNAVEWALRAGLGRVGENRVQEAVVKMDALGANKVEFELIGHLQSNKARVAAERFARVQTVDSAKLLRRLDAAAGDCGRTLPILLQVNAGEDPAKYGVRCEDCAALLETALGLNNVTVEGLMTIAPLDEDPDVARRAFARLRHTRDSLAAQFQVALSELSMGMTDDLESAIAEGSTQIRVGTALFGTRA
ncbi:MAG: YggS family pyridoxal phosphate-dependent enzyme [Opitutales bacterium]